MSKSISKTLINAIEKSKETKYAIAINSGVDHAIIRRFISGERDIKLATAEKLASYLNLELSSSKSKK